MSILHFRGLRALALSSALAAAMYVPAYAAVDVFLNVAPPDDRVEVLPAPRRGYAWAPGYWAQHGHHHLWVPGHWVRERVGYHWYRDRWDRYGDRWMFYRGHWERD